MVSLVFLKRTAQIFWSARSFSWRWIVTKSVRCHQCTSHLVTEYQCTIDEGRTRTLEKLWREFFLDPSQWWDNRLEKVNPRYPDFNHKKKQKSLWLDNKLTPKWVEGKIAAITLGTLQVDIFTWNKRLAKHVKAGHFGRTLELFEQMKREGMDPNRFTYVSVLNACSSLGALEEASRIHQQIKRTGYESDVYVAGCLVDMYAKCGSIVDAQGIFNKMPMRDVVCWNVMILGYVKCGEGQKAMELSKQMYRERVEPDLVSFVAMLNACASVGALEEGRNVHRQVIEGGYGSDVSIGNCLVDMYAKCGSTEDAWRVFNKMPRKDVVACNAMVLAYVGCGKGQKALELYWQMYGQGVQPNCVTFLALLNACSSIGGLALQEGRQVHGQIIERGCESDAFVGNCLVDMYAKCGSIEDAWIVFKEMPTRDVVAWNAMILGYVGCGEGKKALELFRQMDVDGVAPNLITFIGVLNACASVAALDEGKTVHKVIIERGYESDVFVGCGLVDMYAKCGSIEDAWRFFDQMPMKDVASWNAMLAGYARHGYAKEALEHFEGMRQAVQVNEASFTSLLSACSHAGLVDEGLHFFDSMIAVYDISPSMEHYTCVIDLLGRASRLQEAENLIRSMPCEPDITVWMSLLAACRVHGNLDMGERVGKLVLEMDPENAAGYVMLSNVYAAAGKWETSSSIQGERLRRGLKTTSGSSWIEVNSKVHSFGLDENKHPQRVEICRELERLSGQMQEAGYVTR